MATTSRRADEHLTWRRRRRSPTMRRPTTRTTATRARCDRARRGCRPRRPPVGRARDRRGGQGRRRPHPRRALSGAVAGLRFRASRRATNPGRICRAARGIGRQGAGPRADDADRQARLRDRLRQGAADRVRGGACPTPQRQEVELGGFQAFIEQAAGRPQGAGRGRARRRAGPSRKPDTKGEAARAKLRAAPPISLAERRRRTRSSRWSSPAAAPTARMSRSRSSTTRRWSSARSAAPPELSARGCPPRRGAGL